MKKIIIFASGSGSNAENIIQLHHKKDFEVVRIYCNNPQAGIFERAKRLNVKCTLFDRNDWKNQDSPLYQQIKLDAADLVILAGFLWKVNDVLLSEFPDRIVNIHPSLLPKYGGKGMYGHFVHEAVISAGETESGITIHLVNAEYDKGAILFQKAITIPQNTTPEQLASMIHELEYEHFPRVILEYLNQIN